MFKAILISATLLTTPVAAQELVCFKFQELAVAVAEARDRGVPKVMLLSTIPDSAPAPITIMTKQVVDLAYGEGSELSPDSFGVLTFSACMSSFSE